MVLDTTRPSLPTLASTPAQQRIDQVNAELLRLNQQWYDGKISEPKWRQLRTELLNYLYEEMLRESQSKLPGEPSHTTATVTPKAPANPAETARRGWWWSRR